MCHLRSMVGTSMVGRIHYWRVGQHLVCAHSYILLFTQQAGPSIAIGAWLIHHGRCIAQISWSVHGSYILYGARLIRHGRCLAHISWSVHDSHISNTHVRSSPPGDNVWRILCNWGTPEYFNQELACTSMQVLVIHRTPTIKQLLYINVSASEAGSDFRLIDCCVAQLKAGV